MKHSLLVLILCTIAASATAQRGRKTPGVYKLPYTIDSFSYMGETVPVQRFSLQDLNTVLTGTNAHENRVALAISGLQEQLGIMRMAMLNHQKIAIIQQGQKYLDDINAENTPFDPSLLTREYALYYKHRNADSFDTRYHSAAYSTTTTRTPYQEQQAYAAQRQRLQHEETMRLQDSTTAATTAAALQKENAAAAARLQAAQAEEARNAARQKAALIKKYGAKAVNNAANGKVWIGMTQELCTYAVGTDHSIRRTTTQNGITEEWYDIGTQSGNYWSRKIVFRNRVVIAVEEEE